MISTPDRQQAVELINEARQAGARLESACQELGIDARTYQRWTQTRQLKTDGRPEAVRPAPANKLSTEERAQVLAICHEPAYASLPPGQIVPRLVDQGEYLASESTFYRILREADEQHHRGRRRPPRPAGEPPRWCARAPCEVWTWDISWLPGPVKGLFLYLYLIVDLYSRVRPLTVQIDCLSNRLHMNNGVRSTWPALAGATARVGSPGTKVRRLLAMRGRPTRPEVYADEEKPAVKRR